MRPSLACNADPTRAPRHAWWPRLSPLLTVFVLGHVVGCSPDTSPTADSGRHGRWRTSTIDYYLNDEANSATERVVQDTFALWAQHTHFVFHYRGRNGAGLRHDGKSTVSFLKRWPKDIPMTKIGYCRTWQSEDGVLDEADIIFNMEMVAFTTKPTPDDGDYELAAVLTHEIGHLVGLHHLEQSDSIMEPMLSPNTSLAHEGLDEATLAAYRRLYGDDAQVETTSSPRSLGARRESASLDIR